MSDYANDLGEFNEKLSIDESVNFSLRISKEFRKS